jgi:hypothetical protein
LFRAQGPTGSTLARGISFFLGMAKFAGIKVSPNIKVPSGLRSSGATKTKIKKETVANGAPDREGDDPDRHGQRQEPGVMKFEIPIPIDRKVRITIPEDFSADDWTLLQTMFTAYVTRWNAMETPEKDKRPTPGKEQTS